MNYLETASTFIMDFKGFASPEEFEAFKKESETFIAGLKDKPLYEQSKLFMEQYGHIYQIVKNEQKIRILSYIQEKIRIFFILAVISLIVSALYILFSNNSIY